MYDNIESFFWYDLETFGLNPFYDRIAQFAGQRTDTDLNPIGDPVILYCRLSADYIPDPKSCMVTGITPQTVKKNGIPESEFIEKINRLFSEKGTCVCGFNTMRFDDEFIRNALYRNFLDPYEREWKNGCSRWDIIDLVRAAHDFRPKGINWPPSAENGNPVFKLTELTAANNIDQEGAHDAMVDVLATIAVAKLIKEKQPKLFEHYLKLRSKVEVKKILNIQEDIKPVLHTNSLFTNKYGCTSVIVPVSPTPDMDNCILCFNLKQDPAQLFSADADNILRVPGLFKLAINKSPFLAPLNALSKEDYERLDINMNVCMNHYEQIRRNLPELVVKLRSANKVEYDLNSDPDYAIYSRFFTDYDKALFKMVREAPPEQRLNLHFRFKDERCPQMLWRHVCRNYPEVLDEENLKKWKEFSINRISLPPGNPINDRYFVGRKVDEMFETMKLTEKEKAVLLALKEYVSALYKYLGI